MNLCIRYTLLCPKCATTKDHFTRSPKVSTLEGFHCIYQQPAIRTVAQNRSIFYHEDTMSTASR